MVECRVSTLDQRVLGTVMGQVFEVLLSSSGSCVKPATRSFVQLHGAWLTVYHGPKQEHKVMGRGEKVQVDSSQHVPKIMRQPYTLNTLKT